MDSTDCTLLLIWLGIGLALFVRDSRRSPDMRLDLISRLFVSALGPIWVAFIGLEDC